MPMESQVKFCSPKKKTFLEQNSVLTEVSRELFSTEKNK